MEEGGGCLAGGEEEGLRHLGVRGVDCVSRRPLFEDWGSMMLTPGEGIFLVAAVCHRDSVVMKESSSEGKSSISDMTA